MSLPEGFEQLELFKLSSKKTQRSDQDGKLFETKKDVRGADPHVSGPSEIWGLGVEKKT
ncbi:hypothetical protein NYE37_13610 [Thermoactinomyces sp. FSL K6-2592]|jgi:hypothetical protein|uniref:hypothetical protein n=1 Tax=Thermoactinomyces sp. FSL K6-2592 TaxID=2975347 RepID=UPI0030F7BC80